MAGARQGEAGDHPGSMQQQPGSPRRAGAGRREGGGGSHPIALEGIHGAPLHWHKKGVGRACESLCKRQRRGAQGGGRLRLVLTRYPSREGDAGFFGGVCSRRHAPLSYEQQEQQRRQHMAGVRQHPEALQRRGRGRAGDGLSPRTLWGPGPGTPKARGPLLPFLSPIRTVDRDRHFASRQCLAQQGCEMWPGCGEGAGGWRPLEAPLSAQEPSGKRRTLVQLPGTRFFPNLHSPFFLVLQAFPQPQNRLVTPERSPVPVTIHAPAPLP